MTLNQILVTGGAGFIGSHTVELLLRQGKQVVVLDNLSSGKLLNLPLQHPDLEFIEGDILELPLIEDLIQNCDAVLHLAAIASVQQTLDEPIYSMQVNTQGFLHLLEAIRKAKRPIRLVYASSAAVYGDASVLPCSDETPLANLPLSPYAMQKLHDEHYAYLYAELFGVKSLGLRYFNVYGERQDPNSPYSGVISRFLDAYQQDAPLTLFGDGEQSRDFIAVTDVARANVLALQSDYSAVLNIATGEAQSLLQLIAAIEKAGKKPAKLHFEPPRSGDIKASFATTTKAARHLDFTYTMSLAEGIAQLTEK